MYVIYSAPVALTLATFGRFFNVTDLTDLEVYLSHLMMTLLAWAPAGIFPEGARPRKLIKMEYFSARRGRKREYSRFFSRRRNMGGLSMGENTRYNRTNCWNYDVECQFNWHGQASADVFKMADSSG